MRKIVAIGGGKFWFGNGPVNVLPIIREIIRLSGRKRPKVLFIPTASEDRLTSVEMARRLFTQRFGCPLDTLYLLKSKPSFRQIRAKIMGSDVVFVGGGNTLKMILRWRFLGVDKAIMEAAKSGKVLCGPSAGAICWFRQGNSDSRKFCNPKAKLIKVTGLGFINALGCPHYDGERDRKPELKEMMRKTPGVAIAMDDCSALEVVGVNCRAIHSKAGAGVYKVYWAKKKFHHQKLKTGAWMPLSSVLSKNP
ncbi:MAG TPA: Type 1 glutamine amidotransferase-like domain-containing protein [bacterium]|nr:Type 1 glutamine amidotransferase-like domain-containing protein [bacterium]